MRHIGLALQGGSISISRNTPLTRIPGLVAASNQRVNEISIEEGMDEFHHSWPFTTG
jgi:hypothetical protein